LAQPPPAPHRSPDPDDLRAEEAPSTRQEELRSFLFFTVVMAPVLAVLLVATYGFVVWMVQIIAGPPTA
jgi:nitrate reductase NapE